MATETKAVIFSDGKFQGVDNDGKVVPYGKLYFYESTSGNAVATYTTSTMETKNTYPIVLSGSGKADVYLADGQYDVTLKDKYGTTVWTINNYIPAGGNTQLSPITVIPTREEFTGVVGSNIILENTPITTVSIHKNGLLLKENDYALSGNVIVFDSPLIATDEVIVEFSAIVTDGVNKGLIYNVDTLADLQSIKHIYPQVRVSGYSTKGDASFGSHIHEWDADSVEEPIGGLIVKVDGVDTGRYKLRFNGAINVKHLGAKGDDDGKTSVGADDTVPFRKAQLEANRLLTTVYVPNGNYRVTGEIDCYVPMRGESMHNTKIFGYDITSSIVTDYQFTSRTGNDVFTYDRPEKAIFNWVGRADDADFRDMTLFGNDEYVSTNNEFVANNSPICGIRARDPLAETGKGYFRDFTFDQVAFENMHTGIDFKGFIGKLDIYVVNAYIGMIVSEFNDIHMVAHMKTVKQPMIVYESQTVECILKNETSIPDFSLSYSMLDNTKSFNLLGMYSEGDFAGDAHFRIGTLDEGTQEGFEIGCANIKISNCMYLNKLDPLKAKAYIIADKVDGLYVDGHFGGVNGSAVETTKNSKNVQVVTNSNWKTTQNLTNNLNRLTKSIGAPINLTTDPYCNHEFGGMTLLENNSSMTFVTAENGITPLTGKKMLRVEYTTTGSNEYSYIRLIKYPLFNYIPQNSPVTVYAWVYVVGSANLTNENNVRFRAQAEGSGDTVQSDLEYAVHTDMWTLVELPMYDVGASDIDTINFMINFYRYLDVGAVCYVDSFFAVPGSHSREFVKNGVLLPNPMATDMVDYIKYHVYPTETYGGQDFHEGDRIPNLIKGAGHPDELVCTADGNNPNVVAEKWQPIGLPRIDNIPTTNSGAGTIWSNNGVLTLGS